MRELDAGEPTRRHLLGLVGGTTVVGVAGCLGDDGDDGNDGGGSGSHSGSNRYSMEDHPIDEPASFEDGQRCTVCSMQVTNYSIWNGQLAHADGTGKFFCTPGCLTAYYAMPEHPPFDGSAEPIENTWTTDFETQRLIDADEAYFVLDESENVEEPMFPNPRPFARHEHATDYVEANDDLDEDDIVHLEELDEDVARIYRESHL